MKNSVFAIALLVLTLASGSAWAAGPASTTYNWTGFYAGINTGAVIDGSDSTVRTGGPLAVGDPTNPLRQDSGNLKHVFWTFGGQVGYNYQVSCFVLGVETDLNYDSLNDVNSVSRPLVLPLAGNFIHNVTERIDFFGTVRGRVGYTPLDRFLLYVTGGLAYADVESHSNVLFTLGGDNYIGSTSGIRTGWTVGGGTEYAINKRWSLKAEYLYMDFGSKTYTYPVTQPLLFRGGPAYTTDLDTAQHVVRLGINYKF